MTDAAILKLFVSDPPTSAHAVRTRYGVGTSRATRLYAQWQARSIPEPRMTKEPVISTPVDVWGSVYADVARLWGAWLGVDVRARDVSVCLAMADVVRSVGAE